MDDKVEEMYERHGAYAKQEDDATEKSGTVVLL